MTDISTESIKDRGALATRRSLEMTIFGKRMLIFRKIFIPERKIDTIITNSEEISTETQKIYETTEQKDLVVIDDENIEIENISKPLIKVENNVIRHDNLKLALEIINILSK